MKPLIYIKNDKIIIQFKKRIMNVEIDELLFTHRNDACKLLTDMLSFPPQSFIDVLKVIGLYKSFTSKPFSKSAMCNFKEIDYPDYLDLFYNKCKVLLEKNFRFNLI